MFNGLKFAYCPLMGPGQQVPCCVSAKPMWPRRNADAAEVEAICIPAGLQRHVAFDESAGVQPACLEQQLELRIIEMDQGAAQGMGEAGATQAMAGVMFLVHPARVVK